MDRPHPISPAPHQSLLPSITSPACFRILPYYYISSNGHSAIHRPSAVPPLLPHSTFPSILLTRYDSSTADKSHPSALGFPIHTTSPAIPVPQCHIRLNFIPHSHPSTVIPSSPGVAPHNSTIKSPPAAFRFLPYFYLSVKGHSTM